MHASDTRNPEYYHRVVDCQWACPAHTNVPEYIRLIAQGKYTESYLLNRKSNVFPGIPGRVCDRPCEPACRRGRLDEKPVAICRLKRVAADFREDITAQLPSAPEKKNGKRIACIGAGPASLTEVPTGLLYFDDSNEDMHGHAGTTKTPLTEIPYETLCPGAAALEELQDLLR